MQPVPMYAGQRLLCCHCNKMKPVVYPDSKLFTYICQECMDEQTALAEEIIQEILKEERQS